jgi:hypothetical protein
MSYGDDETCILRADQIMAVFEECGFTCSQAERLHKAYTDGAIKATGKKKSKQVKEMVFLGDKQ